MKEVLILYRSYKANVIDILILIRSVRSNKKR